jgi:hypothetical protein
MKTLALYILVILSLKLKVTIQCSCSNNDMADQLRAASIVFSGVAARKSDGNSGNIQVNFKISKVWRGKRNLSTININTPNSAVDDCGFGFEENKRYIVFATMNGDNTFTTDVCSMTQEMSDGMARKLDSYVRMH